MSTNHTEAAVEIGRVRQPYIAVGDDGSRHSRTAVTYAAREASRRRLPLLVVTLHVPVVDPDRSVVAQLRDERSSVQDAEQALASTVTRLRSAYADLDVDGTLLVDPLPEQLARHLAGCALLVLGARSRGGPFVFRFDSTSQRLRHAVRCPFIVVPDHYRPPQPGTTTTVLAGIDGGPLSRSVLTTAAEYAVSSGSGLSVLHAYGASSGPSPEAARRAAEALCARQVEAATLPDGLNVTQTVTADEPSHALLERAASAELLVIGARGSLALGHLTRGSLSHAVLEALPCPLLIVLPQASAPSNRDDRMTASTAG